MLRLRLLVITILLAFTSSTRIKEQPKQILLYTSLAKPNPNWHLSSNFGGYRVSKIRTPFQCPPPQYFPSLQYFRKIHCPFTNCIVTSNKSYLPDLRQYDVIAFNSWDIETFPPPETRHPEQIYLVYFHEAPSRTKKSLSSLSTLFNWTMSYT